MVELEQVPVVHQVYMMTVMYMAATQVWLDTPGRPCAGAVFLNPLHAHSYATERNLRDIIAARSLIERFGFGLVEFPASFDYYYVRERPANSSELAVLYWEGV